MTSWALLTQFQIPDANRHQNLCMLYGDKCGNAFDANSQGTHASAKKALHTIEIT